MSSTSQPGGQTAAPQTSLRQSDGETTVVLEFADEPGYYAWLEKVRSGTPIVRLTERLDEGTRVQVESRCGLQRDLLGARVRQVFRSGAELWGTLLEPAEAENELAVPSASGEVAPAVVGEQQDTAEGALDPVGSPDSEDPEESATAASKRGETYGASAFFELQKLNPNQRVLLATRANRQQRQLLLRDTAQPVQMALLSNPRLEPKEVLEIARNPQSSGGVLQRLATDQRFSTNYDVQLALVRNPQTPSPIALRLMDLMRTSDLRFLAKSQALRENIRKAALRVYLKRAP
jgi:hypothetical protein